MPKTNLPVLVSLPHGGLLVPPEIGDRLAINATQIHNECDLWVDELFDVVAARSLARVSMPVARVLVDANRAPDDWADPDGAIKTTTSYGQPVYRYPLSTMERSHLIQKYYRPFHHSLTAAIAAVGDRTKLFLDCHNMAQDGPAAYSDSGRPRPLICLANFGDATGERCPGGPPTTCDPKLIQAAAHHAMEVFGDMSLLEPGVRPPPIVALNQPFVGGYILRSATDQLLSTGEQRTPGIMVEVNRGLFVGRQSPDTPVAPRNAERIAQIGQRLAQWLACVLADLQSRSAI